MQSIEIELFRIDHFISHQFNNETISEGIHLPVDEGFTQRKKTIAEN
jgi:hypothetical protein